MRFISQSKSLLGPGTIRNDLIWREPLTINAPTKRFLFGRVDSYIDGVDRVVRGNAGRRSGHLHFDRFQFLL